MAFAYRMPKIHMRMSSCVLSVGQNNTRYIIFSRGEEATKERGLGAAEHSTYFFFSFYYFVLFPSLSNN